MSGARITDKQLKTRDLRDIRLARATNDRYGDLYDRMNELAVGKAVVVRPPTTGQVRSMVRRLTCSMNQAARSGRINGRFHVRLTDDNQIAVFRRSYVEDNTDGQ